MIRRNLTIPLYLPEFLYRFLRATKHRLAPTPSKDKGPVTLNLLGDRDVEWSWIVAHIPNGPGKALDFGSGGSLLSLAAAKRGFHVTALDLEHAHVTYIHPEIVYISGDILKQDFSNSPFDLIINCSTVEHIGLVGRYGVDRSKPDGDLEAMVRLRRFMKREAIMLLTIPVGQDAIFPPLCRVYGAKRLPLLLQGYTVFKEEFWTKNEQNRWIQTSREAALEFPASAGSFNVLENVYALGCFVLKI